MQVIIRQDKVRVLNYKPGSLIRVDNKALLVLCQTRRNSNYACKAANLSDGKVYKVTKEQLQIATNLRSSGPGGSIVLEAYTEMV
jgi:hypothetical protein